MYFLGSLVFTLGTLVGGVTGGLIAGRRHMRRYFQRLQILSDPFQVGARLEAESRKDSASTQE